MIDAGVQETLFLPLLGRARAARTWPTCFRDPWSERAVSLAAAVRPDIQDRDMGEMPAAIYALRHLAAVTEIRRYLQDRPAAAVVDLGCGLDRLIDDVDNGGATVYNLDFPEVLRLRSTWMEPHERERDLPASLTDHAWMGGRLVYDAESPELVAASEQAVRERGIDAAPMPFRVADPYAPQTWSRAVADVRVDFDLSSYAPDPGALPQEVRDGFAGLRASRGLYEVVVDFAPAATG